MVDPTAAGAETIDVRQAAARVNLRLAQLAWRVRADVERDPRGAERLVLRPLAEGGHVDPEAPGLRVGAASLARPNLIDAILTEVHALGWDQVSVPESARADVLWCAPA